MKKNLILNPYYLPGYKSGGQQQSVKNLVDTYGKKYNFYILTQNHDFASKKEYTGIETHQWISVGNADVMYLPSSEYRYHAFEKAYLEFDTIYSCGLFSINTIDLLLIHKRKGIKEKKIYIAPMGVFSEGAMQSKHLKKGCFLLFSDFTEC